ncbi:hypothetical protein MMC28_002821 [Mycoblastus sanguinarius]|nr:hypothetical protein [Mycoblastus sanguinarius]
MPPIPPQQQADWENIRFVLEITRDLIINIGGLSYLLRSPFQLLQWSLSSTATRTLDPTPEESIGLDLDDAFSNSPLSFDLDINIRDEEGSNIRPPQPVYNPRTSPR